MARMNYRTNTNIYTQKNYKRLKKSPTVPYKLERFPSNRVIIYKGLLGKLKKLFNK